MNTAHNLPRQFWERPRFQRTFGIRLRNKIMSPDGLSSLVALAVLAGIVTFFVRHS